MNEQEKILAEEEAVKAIEEDLKNAEAVREERMTFPDKIRKYWGDFAFKSTLGTWSVRLVLTVIVFFCVNAAVNYGMAFEGSLLEGIVARYLTDVGNLPLILLGIEALVAIIWLWAAPLGMMIIAALYYTAFAGLAPIALMPAFAVMLMFLTEDRPVTAFMAALPIVMLLTPLPIGLGMVLVAGLVSTRSNNGVVRSMGFVFYALLEFARGTFGKVVDSLGNQIIPLLTEGEKVKDLIQYRFDLLGPNAYYENDLSKHGMQDSLLGPVILLLVVFLVLGIFYTKLLNMRYSRKPKALLRKLPIDIRDAIVFGVMLVLLCVLPTVVVNVTAFSACRIGYGAIILQVIVSYIVTRPVAGMSPKRGDQMMRDSKDYIFISYAHSDLERVRPYLRILSEHGYEFWYDDSIKTGVEWQGVIASNLANCSCFLAFLSLTSVKSDYCLKEINYATSKKKPIAVIELDEIEMPPVLEMHLASLQAVQRRKFESNSACMEKVFELDALQKCHVGEEEPREPVTK